LQAESFNPGDHRPACLVPVVAAMRKQPRISSMHYSSHCGMQPEHVLSRPERLMKDSIM